MPSKAITVPVTLQHPVLQPLDTWESDCTDDPDQVLAAFPLLYDVLYAENKSVPYLPWEHHDRTVPLLFGYCRNVSAEQESRFRQERGKASPELTGRLFCLFTACLYWSSGLPVPSLQMDPEKLSIRPVNLQERLTYIRENPLQYHSFIQLQQLISELEKLYHKERAMKK